MTRRYRVRCGDCDGVLGHRIVNLRRLVRLIRLHRTATACQGSGLVVRPTVKEAA